MKLFVTDSEINYFLTDVLTGDLPVEDLRLAIKPEGLTLSGKYPALGFRVAFEMLWEAAVLAGGVEARLKELSVAGFGAGKLRGVLLKVVQDAAGNTPGIAVDGDRILVDLNALLQSRRARVLVEVMDVRCHHGAVEIEAVFRR
jgi:hypothetical protein